MALTFMFWSQVRSVLVKWTQLCVSLGGQPVSLLTVTNPEIEQEEEEQKKERKQTIILSARVHPGETNASWMMRGFIYFITSDRAEAMWLRNRFVFKLVPMVNPDGVMAGNYRCSLAGLDLNRQWIRPRKHVTPEVWSLKRLLSQLADCTLLFCDFHGHSRKRGAFFYGCNSPELNERRFPFIFGEQTKLFDTSKCSYHISKSKAGTGRVVGRCELGIKLSYTLEASFAGPAHEELHYSISSLEEIGLQFGLALHLWQQMEAGAVGAERLQASLDKYLLEVQRTEKSEGESSAGSDSDPCMGNLDSKELQSRLRHLIAKRKKSARCRASSPKSDFKEETSKSPKVILPRYWHNECATVGKTAWGDQWVKIKIACCAVPL